MDGVHEEALRAMEEALGDRLRRRPARGAHSNGALASVLPVNAGEIELLAEVAARYSIPLVALGAGTTPELRRAEEGGVLIRFDLMRGLRLPGPEEPWIEAEPGALWLELDNNLRVSGNGLAVYPTSAPRATVGGWIAQDGLGVGSFEYGRLRENILFADVVLPGGERRTVRGDEIESIVGEKRAGIVVGATLRTRHAEHDVPFALAFENPDGIAEAISIMLGAEASLWHAAFLNPEMARLRNLGEEYLLFGAYPARRSGTAEKVLREAAGPNGRELSGGEAHRVWGERFFPVAPSRSMPPLADRSFISVSEVSNVLESRPTSAIQGTVARSGEVLLLSFDPSEQPL